MMSDQLKASPGVLANDRFEDALEALTQWPTVLQTFIYGQFVGGCDLISEMY
jgi:monothiol glutaredoxin